MRIIFCTDPLNPRVPDEAFVREVAAAKGLNIPFDLVDHDALVGGRTDAAASRVLPLDTPEASVFRGWMMTAKQYEQLFQLLKVRGRTLINSPEQYVHCHHLPASYDVISAHTPKTVVVPMEEFTFDRVMDRLRVFAGGPVVLKDFVKSQKHSWLEACFIPSADDRAAVERVVRNFLSLQAEFLTGGLVFREFVEFEPVGVHPKSGMPLTREYRHFFIDGERVATFRYWESADYGNDSVVPEDFAEVARRVRSRFFSMDVARTRDGKWMIVELGDGQVAGIPDHAHPVSLYSALRVR